MKNLILTITTIICLISFASCKKTTVSNPNVYYIGNQKIDIQDTIRTELVATDSIYIITGQGYWNIDINSYLNPDVPLLAGGFSVDYDVYDSTTFEYSKNKSNRGIGHSIPDTLTGRLIKPNIKKIFCYNITYMQETVPTTYVIFTN